MGFLDPSLPLPPLVTPTPTKEREKKKPSALQCRNTSNYGALLLLSVAHEKVPGSLAANAAVLPGRLGALKRSSGAYLAELPYRSEQIRT